jgi:hypothetical protein
MLALPSEWSEHGSGLVWNTCSLESIVRLRVCARSAEIEGLSGVNDNVFWDHGKGREGLNYCWNSNNRKLICLLIQCLSCEILLGNVLQFHHIGWTEYLIDPLLLAEQWEWH